MEQMNSKMKLNKEQLNVLIAGFIFAVVFVLRFFHKINLTLISDEIGNLALPAKLAGFKWDDVVYTTKYYGYGYKWFYFLFFKYIHNPFACYTMILVSYLFFFELAFYACSKVILQETKRVIFVWYSLAVFLFFFVTDGNFSPLDSEFAIFFNLFFFVYILYKSQKSEKTWLWSAVLAFWLSYMCTLHERSLAFVLAFFVTVCIDWIYMKKSWLNKTVFICTFAVSYGVKELLTKFIVKHLWENSKGELANTSVVSDSMFVVFRSVKDFLLMLKGMLSNYIVLNINTFGLFTVICLISVLAIIEFFRKDKKWKELYENNHFWFIVLMLCFFTVVIILVGISAKWAGQIINGNPHGYKGFIYKRYYITWIYPALIALLVILKNQNITNFSKLVFAATFINIGCYILFITNFIKTLISVEEQTGKNIFIYRIGMFGEILPNQLYFNVILSMIFSVLAMWIFLSRDKTSLCFIVIVMGIFLDTRGFQVENYEYEYYFEDVYNFLTSDTMKECVPNDIYLLTKQSTDSYTLQYVLNNNSIIPTLPDDLDEVKLVVSRENEEDAEKLIQNGFKSYYIGKKQYLWSKDKELQECIDRTLNEDGKVSYELDEEDLFYSDTQMIGSFGNMENGTYDIYVETKKTDEKVGLDIVCDGKVLNNKFDEIKHGNEIVYHTTVDLYSNRMFAIYVNASKKIQKAVKIRYEYMRDQSSVGIHQENEIEALTQIINKIDINKPLLVLSYNNNIETSLDLSFIKKKMGSDIAFWDYFDAKEENFKSTNASYLLVSNYRLKDIIFDLVKYYDVVGYTKNYTLLLSRNSETKKIVAEKDIKLLNDGNCVSSEIFNPDESYYFSVSFPAGCYELVFDGTKLEDNKESIYEIYQYASFEYVTEVKLESRQIESRKIVTDGNENYLFFSKNEEAGKAKIYIKKTTSLESGDQISLCDDKKLFYYPKGFYLPVDDGCYVMDRRTTLELPIDEERDIIVIPYMRSLGEQEIAVYVGDNYIDDIHITENFEAFKIPVSKEDIKDGKISISLYCTRVYSLPDELEIGDEQGVLKTCLQIQSIDFE